MPFSTKQNNSAMTHSQQPSTEEIATLNTLLIELQTLAKQVNYPLTNALFSILRHTLLSFTSEIEVETMLVSAIEDMPPLLQSACLFFLISGVLYAHYKAWQGCAAVIGKFFPNGFSLNRKMHEAFEMQHKLGTKEKLTEYIAQLRKLTLEQQDRIKTGKYLSLFINLGIPVLSSITVFKSAFEVDLGSFGLFLSLLGPYVAFSPNKSVLVPEFVNEIASNQQSLLFDQTIYSLWDNYNTPKQITMFKKRLSRLSCYSHEWEIYQGDEKNKISALAMLNLGPKRILIQGQDNKHHEVSRKNYFVALYRLLLRESFSVYVNEGKRIYVGYCELSERRSKKLRQQLLPHLIELEESERNGKKMLTSLNIFNKLMGVNLEWAYHLEHKESAPLDTIYYLEISKLSTNENDFISSLGTIIKENLVLDENIIYITHSNINQVKLDEFVSQKKSQKNLENTSWQDSSAPEARNFQRKRKNTPSNTQDKKIVARKADSPYPPRINFKNGVTFFSDKKDDDQPENFAYPLHLPWRPEGRVYASVDPNVFEKVSNYLNKKQVLERVIVGAVHSESKQEKSKMGGVGIQKTDEPYKNIYGKTFLESGFKLKYANNIRIFGHKEDQVTLNGITYEHYRFDGPALGH